MKSGLTEIETIQKELLPDHFYKIVVFKRTWEQSPGLRPIYEVSAMAISERTPIQIKRAWAADHDQEKAIEELKILIRSQAKKFKIAYQEQTQLKL